MLNLYEYHNQPDTLLGGNEQYKYVPELAYDYALRQGKRIPELEPAILRDTDTTHSYVHNIVKNRWPEAEKILMDKPFVAFQYAQFIIHGRWPEAEKYIISNPYVATLYAKNVIHGRWPELEKILLKHDYAELGVCLNDIFNYTEDVIQGPWPEAEKIFNQYPNHGFSREYQTMVRLSIMKTLTNYGIEEHVIDAYTDFFRRFEFPPKSMASVAIDLLKRRWKEAEPYIKQDSNAWKEYKQTFNME